MGLGLWTLVVKEVLRFLKNPIGSVLGPLVTLYLFLTVFSLALGDIRMAGSAFLPFLAPGLILMAMMQTGFENTAFSVMSYRNYGDFVDLLMPPMSPGQLVLGLVAGGVVRGLLVGAIAWLAVLPFVDLWPFHLGHVVFHATVAVALMSILGVISGLWAEKWERLAVVGSFVIAPLAFLSGTFYSIAQLPEPWRDVALWNPFFYLINGFRYGFIGRSDAPLSLGFCVITGLLLASWLLCHALFRHGYKLKP